MSKLPMKYSSSVHTIEYQKASHKNAMRSGVGVFYMLDTCVCNQHMGTLLAKTNLFNFEPNNHIIHTFVIIPEFVYQFYHSTYCIVLF
ncbi:unnamed protein product [Medioppia subpectinata]|uniref:Uncharacterized protein n=1 Tax=Medioppia subpectinata TaxID=1979941 RepID=A0A7R9QD57_9ACAR|nr:unnamed protein product [Medioppia subpectinata]CAG2118232.1 unnamed protein product [Medioppia subpectinata]